MPTTKHETIIGKALAKIPREAKPKGSKRQKAEK